MPESGAGGLPARGRMRFREELADFLSFVRRPTLARLPRRPMSAARAEWLAGLVPARLLRWVLVMWAVNLLLLGPLAAVAVGLTGSEHRLAELVLTWFRVIVWAPLLEEMLLRFGLRRPAQALWIAPVLIVALFTVRTPVAALLVAMSAGAVLALLAMQDYRWPWARLRRYREIFPYVFHLVTLAFACLHLGNFRIGLDDPWLLPLLVLPQWASGLVLGWIRVRTGIGASIVLHAMFNAGPIALLWTLQRYAPGM